MPEDKGGVLHYDINDPADLAVLIEGGLIWKGGPKAIKKAIDAIVSGSVPRPTANVPAEVNAHLDSVMGATEVPVEEPPL
jgi:hypothetical protein